MAIDERAGAAELEELADRLGTPCQLGEYSLEGVLGRTSTALVFVVRGGVFGQGEGVIKLTGAAYAPLLERELRLLTRCAEAGLGHIVRPVRAEVEWLEPRAAAMLLPFLDGGDLVQWIGAHTPGPGPALEVGEHVGGVLRSLLQLPQPLVHRDVKPQNVLLADPAASLSDMTVIDFDVAEELDIPHTAFAAAPREIAESLVGDVRGFGELLFDVATGHDPPALGPLNPRTGQAAFDALVEACLTSVADGAGYTSMTDDQLWRDLRAAQVEEHDRTRTGMPGSLLQLVAHGTGRRYLAIVGAFLFLGLVVAVATKLWTG